MDGYLVREVTEVTRDPRGVTCTLRAVACVGVPGMPGFLTGEPYDVQGIETLLPNLPPLELPPVDDERTFTLRVTAVAAETVRIVVTPEGEPADDGTSLGIVTDPYPGAPEVAVREARRQVELSTGRVCVRIGRMPFSLHVEDRRTGGSVLRSADRLRQAAGLPMAPALRTDAGRVR